MFGLRTKFVAAFFVVASYTALVSAYSQRSSLEIKNSIEQISVAITPLIEAISHTRISAVKVMEEALNSRILLSLEADGTGASIAREQREAKEASAQLIDSVAFINQLKSTRRSNTAEIDELLEFSSQALGLAEKLLSTNTAMATSEILIARERIEEVSEWISTSAKRAVELEILEIKSQVDSTALSLATHDTRNRWIGATMFLFAICTALLLAHGFSKPIIQLKAAAMRVKHGDLKTRVAVKSEDEIGQLSTAFNDMVENLSRTTVSRTFFEGIIESMKEALVVVDKSFQIRFSNGALRALLQLEAPILTDSNLSQFLEYTVDEKDLVSSGKSSVNNEGYLLPPNGEKIPIRFAIASIEGGDMDRPLRVLVIRDVRQDLRVESEMQAYRERITQAEKLASLGTLGAIIAHKLNQPLTSIRLFLQQISKAIVHLDLPARVHENMNDCLSEIERASRAVQEVLADTRKPHRERTTEIVISEIAARATRALSEAAKRASVRISIDGLSNLPRGRANQVEIEEVFHILLNNAIQAARDGMENKVTIRGAQKDSTLILTFEDSCGGVPEKLQSKMFDQFFSTKLPEEGSGLGLHILKQIAAKYGGEVAFSSVENEGSRFIVSLPIL